MLKNDRTDCFPPGSFTNVAKTASKFHQNPRSCGFWDFWRASRRFCFMNSCWRAGVVNNDRPPRDRVSRLTLTVMGDDLAAHAFYRRYRARARRRDDCCPVPASLRARHGAHRFPARDKRVPAGVSTDCVDWLASAPAAHTDSTTALQRSQRLTADVGVPGYVRRTTFADTIAEAMTSR